MWGIKRSNSIWFRTHSWFKMHSVLLLIVPIFLRTHSMRSFFFWYDPIVGDSFVCSCERTIIPQEKLPAPRQGGICVPLFWPTFQSITISKEGSWFIIIYLFKFWCNVFSWGLTVCRLMNDIYGEKAIYLKGRRGDLQY